eukprot:Rmarinus@m.12785
MKNDGVGAIQLRPCTPTSLQGLRSLNLAIFPVRYSDQFYRNILDQDQRLTRIATVTEAEGPVDVGAVSCRLDSPPTRLYIMTLGVIPTYRRSGVGSRLIKYVVQELLSQRDFQEVEEIYLHVQTTNRAALAFYQQEGFEIGELVKEYYRRIPDRDCYIVRKRVRGLKRPMAGCIVSEGTYQRGAEKRPCVSQEQGRSARPACVDLSESAPGKSVSEPSSSVAPTLKPSDSANGVEKPLRCEPSVIDSISHQTAPVLPSVPATL